jgi:bacteriorhodopsin
MEFQAANWHLWYVWLNGVIGAVMLVLVLAARRRSAHFFAEISLILLAKTVAALLLARWSSESLFMDWFVTTPFTLLLLWRWAVGPDSDLERMNVRERTSASKPLLFALIGADWLMLLCGLLAGRLAGGARWSLFAAACILMVLILLLMWRNLRIVADNQTDSVKYSYYGLATFVSASWFLFPLLWLCSPYALGLFSYSVLVECFAAANWFTKAGLFGLAVFYLIRMTRVKFAERRQPR